jgi:hypothetical protein
MCFQPHVRNASAVPTWVYKNPTTMLTLQKTSPLKFRISQTSQTPHPFLLFIPA